METFRPKSILAFDLDGTLTPRNRFDIHPPGLSLLLNTISEMGHFVIPVTGKPIPYAAKLFPTNNLTDRGIIAENAGVYRLPGQDTVQIFGPGLDQMHALRDKLDIGMEKVNVTNIDIEDINYEVVVDPDDVSILTIFTEPSHVSHRWSFTKSIDADTLVEKLKDIISANNWENHLVVLPPFPDGGIQVIRKDPRTGHPVDKSSLIFALEAIYPKVNQVPIAMFGDGHNDIPAMKSEHIIPLTFANAHEDVIKFVKTRNGHISQYIAPEGNGVAEGLLWLSAQNFFGNDSETVTTLVQAGVTGEL